MTSSPSPTPDDASDAAPDGDTTLDADTTQAQIILLRDEAATAKLGADLAHFIQRGDFIALWGDLGAGKTALARAVIEARLAAHGIAEEVPSPTFTLVQTYEMPDLTIAHADLYRIGGVGELIELGLDEARETGAVLLEWPDRMGGELPADRLDIHLELTPDGGRQARLVPHGQWRARLKGFRP